MNLSKVADLLDKSAYGVLARFVQHLKPRLVLSPSEEDEMIIAALQQHGDHLGVHRIEQVTIDAFKFVCWLGGSLLKIKKDDEVACAVIIDALLATLEEFLVSESKWRLVISPSTVSLLKSFLLQERCGNAKHGIWMNGLYVAFHCSLSTWQHGRAYKDLHTDSSQGVVGMA